MFILSNFQCPLSNISALVSVINQPQTGDKRLFTLSIKMIVLALLCQERTMGKQVHLVFKITVNQFELGKAIIVLRVRSNFHMGIHPSNIIELIGFGLLKLSSLIYLLSQLLIVQKHL